MEGCAVTKKLTIRDIARLAGVSTATVSRVLNQKPDVDPETRERVMDVVNAHHYVPNMTASSLAGGRSRLLGVLVPSLTWPLMPSIMQGIAEVIEQTTYELVLYSISHRTDRSALIDRILATRLIDGLIAVYPDGEARAETADRGDRDASRHLVELYEQGFPVVILDDQSLPLGSTPWVGPDNRVGAFAAVGHLVSLGHRRIAHVQGPLEYQCSHDRYAGYTQALERAGTRVAPELVVRGDFTTPAGYAAAMRLLDLADRPTAVFAANDQMAYGVLAAAKERGLRLPEELSVIGFDDTVLSAHVRPALTTVRQPFDEMGRRAAELLLALVDAPRVMGPGWRDQVARLTRARGEPVGQAVRIQLPTELVLRESCGARSVDRSVDRGVDRGAEEGAAQTRPSVEIPVD
jgi:LacI family transcriptional regulator, galactose operon repressor